MRRNATTVGEKHRWRCPQSPSNSLDKKRKLAVPLGFQSAVAPTITCSQPTRLTSWISLLLRSCLQHLVFFNVYLKTYSKKKGLTASFLFVVWVGADY